MGRNVLLKWSALTLFDAARIKATKRMAYSDCFAVALVRLKKAELYTGDPEFKDVEKDIKILRSFGFSS